MNNINNGGPAFPTTDFTHAGQVIPGSEGMTLRDYFAAKAMQGLLAFPGTETCGSYVETSAEVTAAHAYIFADAMLKAREAK